MRIPGEMIFDKSVYMILRDVSDLSKAIQGEISPAPCSLVDIRHFDGERSERCVECHHRKRLPHDGREGLLGDVERFAPQGGQILSQSVVTVYGDTIRSHGSAEQGQT